MTNVVTSVFSNSELVDLCHEVHSTAVEKGWWPAEAPIDTDRLNELLVLVSTELSEAFECYRQCKTLEELPAVIYVGDSGKPEGFGIEMADAYIRVLDILGGVGLLPVSLTVDRDFFWENREPTVGSGIFRILSTITSERGLRRLDTEFWSWILAKIEAVCEAFRIDLRAAVTIKMAYNKTRSFRHGGKKA